MRAPRELRIARGNTRTSRDSWMRYIKLLNHTKRRFRETDTKRHSPLARAPHVDAPATWKRRETRERTTGTFSHRSISPSGVMTTKGDSFIDAVEGKWMCGICLGVYRRPVVFPCGNGHSFCEACAHEWQQTSVRERREGEFGTTCPICRVRVAGRGSTPDEALRRGLKSTVVACGCGENVVLSLAREHIVECPITKDEAALTALAERRERMPKLAFQPVSGWPEAVYAAEADRRRRSQAVEVRMFREAEVRRRLEPAANASANDDENDDENEETLNNDVELVCPICVTRERPSWRVVVDELGLDVDELPPEDVDREVENFFAVLEESYHFNRRRDLIVHVLDDHDHDDTIRAVCPICASFPHGDPNYHVEDFYDHIIRRHGFDWTVYMPDLDRDEEEVLHEVLRASRDAA